MGLYPKHPIRSIHSNIGLGLPGERTFSRDCAEFEIEARTGDTIWMPVSKGYGCAAEIERVAHHVLEVRLLGSASDRRPGTYGSGAKSNKIDYILLSSALWATVSAVGVERRGVWAPRTFPHFPEIGSAVEAASDHPAVWIGLSVAMRIGVDLGGTKIEAVVIGEHSRLVVRERMATPQSDAIQKRPKLLDTREP